MTLETACDTLTRHICVLRRTAIVCLLAAPLLVAGALTGAAAEQALPTAEQILDRHVEVTGGRAAYDKIENRVTKATLEIVGQGLSLDMTIYMARPNKNYTLIESELIGKAEKGTDGETAWELSMMTGPQIMKGKQKSDFLRDAEMDRLARWREEYASVESAGTEKVGETICYKVVLTQEDGPPMTLFFDPDSYLIAKMTMDLETPMGIVPMESFPGEFREVDGLLLAHGGTVKLAGQERRMTIHSVEHNVDLPADRFELPEEIRALMNKQAPAE